ncbi:MAG TPA: HD domain-containing protein [Anaerovoracaceae bacterium]|nr:HD domain-containing protein [Anaerovoracaceae bacterium]
MDNQEPTILIDCIENLSQNNSFVNMRKYIQHGHTDCLLHSIAVAYFSYTIANCLNLKLNERSLITGALLHDYFLYDWHKPDISHRFHGFTHPKTALENALHEWELNETEIDIITKHMFPLIPALPRYKESILVCIIDKICSIWEILSLPTCKEVRHLYDCAINCKK